MTLPGKHVTQYMHVLFTQVHVNIQEPQFTFGFASKTSREFAQRHQFTEILIINIDKTSVIHRFKDELLLNATAVSDFKNNLRKKQTMQ